MSDAWALRGLRWTYCAFIAWSSGATLVQACAEHNLYIVVLAGIELIAVTAFLWPRFERAACAVLLAVYPIAALLTVFVERDMPLRFIYFAMTAISIGVLDRSPALSR